jgi:small subunit ribosomal protein S20
MLPCVQFVSVPFFDKVARLCYIVVSKAFITIEQGSKSNMPIIKSAKKRVKVANKAAIRNSKTKRSLKSAIKNFGKALTAKDKKTTMEALDKVQSELDKAGKKGVMHKNKVARKKAQAARAAKAASGVTKTATPKTKAPAKKPAVKKAPAKKAVPAKKPAAKKTTTKK